MHRARVRSTSSSATFWLCGRRNNYLMTGRRESMWKFQRKEPWATVTTGEESLFFLPQQDPSQAHHQVYLWSSWPATQTKASRFSKRKRMHRPDLHSAQHYWTVHWMAGAVVHLTTWILGRLSTAPTRKSNFGAYTEHMEFHNRSSTWILKRLSTAPTKKVYGAYSGHMEFQNKSSLLSRASTATSCAKWEKSESSFGEKTRVRQRCPMSASLFNLMINWAM